MSAPLTILLIDNSPITSVRLVELLQNTEEVYNVFYAKDVKKGCRMFSVGKIDLIILATHLVNDELVKMMELCKVFKCEVILLTQYTHSSYRNWCKSIGIDYLLDKAAEVNQVETVLKQIFNP